MDEATHFENFYNEKLAPVLPGVRAACRQSDGWGITAIVSALFGFGCFIGYHADVLSGELASLLFVFFAGLLVLSIYEYAKQKDNFDSAFKAAIIRNIMDDVCPGLVYKPDEHISSREYKRSSLYRYRYDYYNGDDLVEGVINGIFFRCSELHVQSDYYGSRQINVFKGLFFTATINSRFAGGTYIWQRNRAQLATSIMDEDYRLLPMPHVANVHFDDARFNQCFRVCSTSPEEAHEICNDAMRKKMVEVFTWLNGQVSFSFVTGKCYIAVPIVYDLLEPSDYDPGDKIEMGKYFITIRLIANMFRQLDLTTLQ